MSLQKEPTACSRLSTGGTGLSGGFRLLAGVPVIAKPPKHCLFLFLSDPAPASCIQTPAVPQAGEVTSHCEASLQKPLCLKYFSSVGCQENVHTQACPPQGSPSSSPEAHSTCCAPPLHWITPMPPLGRQLPYPWGPGTSIGQALS